MKIPRIANAVGHIDDELIAGAESAKVKRKNSWLKYAVIAACLTVAVVVSLVMIPFFKNNDTGKDITTNQYDTNLIFFDELNRKYKEYTGNEFGIGWWWDYKIAIEKYRTITIKGHEYSAWHSTWIKELDAALIGNLMGIYEATGYGYEYGHDATYKTFYKNFEVYYIKDIDNENIVAVNLDGSYYLFIKDGYNVPDSLKELLPNPNHYHIAGTIVEVGDGYILIDDSVLCVDSDDGMVFKLPTDDLRISRYIYHYNLKVGDTVMISFIGKIDIAADNLIYDAYSILQAEIADGVAMVPE